jgi:hypothetical protein
MRGNHESISGAGKRVEFIASLQLSALPLRFRRRRLLQLKILKMIKIKWMLVGMTAALLCGCASDGSPGDVQVSSQSATPLPAVPTSACRVSSHPPMGTYTVIAQMTATGQVNESSSQLLARLQKQGAALGSTYVMVTSVSDKNFINPENSEVISNPYLSQEASFYSTAIPGGAPQSAVLPVVTAEALKITSGSNKPNKGAPSNLWQNRPQ